MILAAGKSTRLAGLGKQLPKPMLPLRGRPVLGWTIERLRDTGITEIIINLYHARDTIPAHFGDGSAWGVHIAYSVEDELLGTAGAVRRVRARLEDGCFLLLYGDTVPDWDPTPMVFAHARRSPIATIAVAKVDDPARLGVVCLDTEDRITAFVEKPGQRPELGRWVNAGVYVLDPRIFEYIPNRPFSDFGGDVFPMALSHGAPLYSYRRPGPLLLIDTLPQYETAEQAWTGLIDPLKNIAL
jgi:NDP-sugar pyrophosphorylase family protein